MESQLTPRLIPRIFSQRWGGENDIEISKGSDRFRPGRGRGHDFLYSKGRVKVVVLSDQGKEAVVGF